MVADTLVMWFLANTNKPHDKCVSHHGNAQISEGDEFG
jgi:hypothetical protein